MYRHINNNKGRGVFDKSSRRSPGNSPEDQVFVGTSSLPRDPHHSPRGRRSQRCWSFAGRGDSLAAAQRWRRRDGRVGRRALRSSIEALRGSTGFPAGQVHEGDVVNLHLKPTIALGELDGANTSGIIERVFLFPPASLDGSDGSRTREPHIARVGRARHFGQLARLCMAGRGAHPTRGLGLARFRGATLRRHSDAI